MSVLIDTQRYQMEMLSGNVLMLEDDIRLVAVTHTFHVFLCDLTELFVGQLVFRRGIQRSMENRAGRPSVGFEVRPETLHAGVDSIGRTVRVSSARGALRLHPYPLSPCYNTTLHRARNPILYSQPFLSLFGKVQYLDTKGFQFPHALFQCGDLMRDCDVGEMRIDSLYNLIMQAKYPAPCLISKIGFPILASEPDVHLPAYPALH